MKVLVTGTAGFIGSFVAKTLIQRGDEVVGLDCINDYYDVRIKYGRLAEAGIAQDSIVENQLLQSSKYPNYRFICLELEDRENLMNLFKNEKFDKVCNLAAQAGVRYSLVNPYAYIQSNIVGFVNILEACPVVGCKPIDFDPPEDLLFFFINTFFSINVSSTSAPNLPTNDTAFLSEFIVGIG
ncbi:GDP-mannose 4,6-dehydratase, partial [Helicobacter ganmani]|uniref:GDP-mannose 4,6-dehydratase n=1 Tax=Helicobacter ganmani TaxID=60246 RepID=UPI003A876F95